MSEKSNFSFIPIIIIALAIGISKCDLDSFNKKKMQSFKSYDHTIQNTKDMPDWFVPLINRIIKEGKIKDKNYEPIKPVNPHK